MLLPFLPASQQFISFNLIHYILCLLGLWRFNNPHVQLVQSRTPQLLAGLMLATAINDCPASVHTTCTWIRDKIKRATWLHPCCLQKTNSSTAMKSAKAIQCFPPDPRRCFLASLSTSLLAHQPHPPKAIEMLVLLSPSLLFISKALLPVSPDRLINIVHTELL